MKDAGTVYARWNGNGWTIYGNQGSIIDFFNDSQVEEFCKKYETELVEYGDWDNE